MLKFIMTLYNKEITPPSKQQFMIEKISI